MTAIADYYPGEARPDHAPILHELQEEYDSYIQAVREKDVEKILSMLTADFIWTLSEGTTYNRAETEAALREQFQMRISLDEINIAILEFTTDGMDATVVVQENSRGLSHEWEGSRFFTMEAIREIWKNTPQGWKIHSATVLHSQTLLTPVAAAEQ